MVPDGRVHCVSGHLDLAPAGAGTLRVVLRRESGDTLKGEEI